MFGLNLVTSGSTKASWFLVPGWMSVNVDHLCLKVNVDELIKKEDDPEKQNSEFSQTPSAESAQEDDWGLNRSVSSRPFCLWFIYLSFSATWVHPPWNIVLGAISSFTEWHQTKKTVTRKLQKHSWKMILFSLFPANQLLLPGRSQSELVLNFDVVAVQNQSCHHGYWLLPNSGSCFISDWLFSFIFVVIFICSRWNAPWEL